MSSKIRIETTVCEVLKYPEFIKHFFHREIDKYMTEEQIKNMSIVQINSLASKTYVEFESSDEAMQLYQKMQKAGIQFRYILPYKQKESLQNENSPPSP